MAKKMAKGTVWLMIAMSVFIGSGYVIHFGLARMVNPEEYGIYGVVLSLLAITQIFLQNGVPQSVSKFVAEGRNINRVKREGLKAQILFLSVIFPIYFFSAPIIAGLLGDPSLTIYIELSALLLPLRAIYLVSLGLLDGARKFGKDAKTRIFYSFTRVGAVFLLVFLGLGIVGIIFGFMFAGICAIVLVWYFVSNLKTMGEKDIGWKTIASFSLPIVVFAAAYTALMNIDILFVKSLIVEDEYTGYYTSAWSLTRAPYYIFLALSFTLLPSISKSSVKYDLKQIQSYISHSLRYYSIIVIPIAFLTLATAPALLSFLFTSDYSVAGDSLRILIFGISFLVAFIIMSMIMVGVGKPKIPMIIGIALVPIDVILNYLFVPEFGLNGAALSTTISAFIGMVIVALLILKTFKVLMKATAFCKVLFSSLIIFLIAYWLNFRGFLLIGLLACLIPVYIALLYVLKEIKEEDMRVVRGVLGK